jgi:hypothetical protein
MLGATAGPPPILGAPVSYGDGGCVDAGAGLVDRPVTFVGVEKFGLGRAGLRLGEETTTGGRVVLSDWVGEAATRGEDGCGAGVPAAGASSTGTECGGVCAQAPTQTEEIRKEVDASKRVRTDIDNVRPIPPNERLRACHIEYDLVKKCAYFYSGRSGGFCWLRRARKI